jgi:CRISPR-associated protein Csd1
MILQALKEYYDRKETDPDSEVAPTGFEWKEIPYIVELGSDGIPVSLSSTYEGDGKNRRAKRFLVPQAVKKTVRIDANLLWENPEYALGVPVKGKPDRVKKQHAEFIERIETLGECDDDGLRSLRAFLALADKEVVLEKFSTWTEIRESGANLSFGLAGEPGLILERPSVRNAIERFLQGGDAGEPGICLISGCQQPIERLHASIKGVRGSQTSGANIVSFNLDAFTSFGKKQGANAPVGRATAFAYTTALNHLLSKDSRQRMLIGDATTVFWAQKPTDMETQIVDIFGEPETDDPDRGVKAVESLFEAVKSGVLATHEGRNRFYVLGLSPNASRIAIRFWINDTVAGMAGKIVQHFEDLRIVCGPKEKEILPLWRLFASTAVQGKSENIPPNLVGETMRAILDGIPYPLSLLQAVVRRIRAEHDVTYARASLIKACINRRTRFDNPQIKEELNVSLDTSNTKIGYRLGRLFATLEKIQAEANPGINATIRDRFYGAASGTPVTVFSNLMRLKNHHLSKLDSLGRRIYFEKLIAEIMDAVEDFPAHLSLPDQGRFAIGYYHQIQKFYSKKETNQIEVNTQTEGEVKNG